MLITLVTEAGTKRVSALRANSVWPLDKSISSATGMSSGTGAGGVAGAIAIGDWPGIGCASNGSATARSGAPAIVRMLYFNSAPTAQSGGAERDQPLVWIRASV